MKNKADNKKRNFLTHSEIESLLKAANTGPHAARNYCLTLLCFIHGFRASEICRLRISDIDLKAKCIYMGLPRSWWEGSERHIQLSVVEHHPQFKALPVSVSPGFYPQQPDLAVKCLRISV